MMYQSFSKRQMLAMTWWTKGKHKTLDGILCHGAVRSGKTMALTYDDLELDSPYNTYKYVGLTPGPISNPSQESLNAAVSPKDTKYFYYALDPSTGEHRFFKTYKEHLAFLDSLEG